MTDTFAGIRPTDVPGFLISQAVGAAMAVAIFGWLMPVPKPTADWQVGAISSPTAVET
jgi:hypothetical protein